MIGRYDGETFERYGVTFRVVIERDHDDMNAPWEDHDCHGSVSDYKPRRNKEAGEVKLCSDEGRDSHRFYNWEGSTSCSTGELKSLPTAC